MRIAGLLLAAGSGRRFGGPKALADSGDGPWVLRALRTLDGLRPRVVVVGAAAGKVTALLPADVTVVDNPDHAGGMGSSLVAGLRALDPAVDAAVVMLVDLPDVPAAAVARVVAAARRRGADSRPGAARQPAAGTREAHDQRGAPGRPGSGERSSGERLSGDRAVLRRALVRAVYHGTPGHPVLIGADHVPGVLASAGGDRGARDYLAANTVTAVECGDLAGGADVDESPSG